MDGHTHLEGRPRCPLLVKLYLEVQKITAHAWLSPPYEETVLGPMSLKERGDRRRPRIANLVQFAVTSNSASTKCSALTHSLTFVPAYTKSRFVGPRCSRPAYRTHIAQELQTRSRVGLRSLGNMRNLHKPFVRSRRWNRAFDNRPVSCRVQPGVVSLPKEMRNVLR